MKLTRTGYNFFVLVWLAPLILFDYVGNTIYTGVESDFYYYKFMADCAIAFYACWQIFGRAQTASAATAKARVHDNDDAVIGFEKLGAMEYLYCLVLMAYSAGNWYELHLINKASTGIVSTGTLLWSFASLIVAFLSAVQFYHLKSGAIVQLKHRIAD